MDTKKVKVYKFFADWCQPCKHQTKLLEETPLCVELISVNVDKEQELVSKFGIRSLPTLVLVDDEDTLIKTWNGLTIPSKINDFINESGL